MHILLSKAINLIDEDLDEVLKVFMEKYDKNNRTKIFIILTQLLSFQFDGSIL